MSLKNIKLASLALILMLVGSACSLFEKDIEVPQEFTFLLDQSSNTSPSFAIVTDKDTRDEDIEKHKKNIKDSKIEKITFTVSNYSGASGSSLSANVMFAAKGTNNFKKLGSISNADLLALSANGSEVTVNISDTAAKDALKDMIIAGNIISFKIEGSTSSTPTYARLNFKVYSNITVGI